MHQWNELNWFRILGDILSDDKTSYFDIKELLCILSQLDEKRLQNFSR
jgi:hypothetical protein